MTAKLTPATVRALLDRATKGPWRVEKDGAGAGRHRGMLEVIGPRMTCRGFTVATDVSPEMAAITRADAALIASAPDLAAAYLEALAVIEEIAGTKWLEDEPASGWIPDGAEGYVGEMESFCNWATERARAFLAKNKEQEA